MGWIHNYMRAALLCLAALVGLVALFVALQALVLFTTSDRVIMARLGEAVRTGVLAPTLDVHSPYGDTGLDYDMFTECLALSTNLGNEDWPLMNRVLLTPHPEYRDQTKISPCEVLVSELAAGTLAAQSSYMRYWHGHQIYLRPMLSIMSLAKVHIANAMLIIASLGALTLAVRRRFGTCGAVGLVFLLIAGSNILTVPAVTVHALTWAFAFASAALIAEWVRTHEAEAPKTIALVFSCGCIAAFFDLLFSPPFAPTLIAFFAIASALERQTARRAIGAGAAPTIAWFAGFGLAWAGKWVLAASVMGWTEMLADIIGVIQFRSLGEAAVSAPPLAVTAAAFRHGTLIGCALVAALFITGFAKPRREQMRTALLLTPLIIPILWIELLRNHSLEHPAFAARSFVLFAVIPLLAALSLRRAAKVN